MVWSLADAQRGISTLRCRLTHHTDVVYALRLAFGSLFSSSADKTIKRYELPAATSDAPAAGPSSSSSPANNVHGSDVAGATSSTSALSLPPQQQHHRMTLSWEAHAHSITCLAAAEQLGLLCSGAEDGRISLWKVDAESATSVGTLSARPSAQRPASSTPAVYALAVSPRSGDVLFAGGADYRVHMYDLVQHTLLHTLTGHASTVRALCFTPDGSRLCSSGGDFNLLVWRVPGSGGQGEPVNTSSAAPAAAPAAEAPSMSSQTIREVDLEEVTPLS